MVFGSCSLYTYLRGVGRNSRWLGRSIPSRLRRPGSGRDCGDSGSKRCRSGNLVAIELGVDVDEDTLKH